MSSPLRSQQRFPFRIPVRLYPNYKKLPPISPNLTEPNNERIPTPIGVTNVDISCETPRVDTRDFWTKLQEHLIEERNKYSGSHGNQQAPNKVVRIFVSSTFTDFFNEREVLIKKVFPALREEMEPKGIQIIDCDLRWGVPKDSTTEQTILACLEELDRCLEDNGQPFFLGLISDKYGWVPKLNQLPKEITERYRWIDGASITLMEFIHGAFRSNNPNACFLVRNSENIFKNLSEKYVDKFRDSDVTNQKQIEQLKAHLAEIMSSEQIFFYDCFYDGLDSSTGRERVKIDGLQTFENQAKKFLSQAIEKWYPDNFDVDQSSNTDEKQMTTFLVNKTQLYVDRLNEYSSLMKYITNDHEDLQLIENTEEKQDEICQPLMTVIGPTGFGKTIFLAKFASDIEKTMKDKIFLFYYFFDGAFHANATDFMLNSIQNKFEKYLNENNLLSKKTNQRLKISDENFLSQAIELISIPLVIIIDGLDKNESHQERHYQSEFPLNSFSDLFSDHTYLILSCEDDSKLSKLVLSYRHYEIKLQSLTIEQRQIYVQMFFQRFNKILEEEQKRLLVNNHGGKNPLYLSYVCENLRQFGDYSLVTKRLKTYPQTIDELLDFLLNEVYTIIENSSLIDAFFKLLVVSNIGILESDVVNLLSLFINNEKIDINQMTWSILRRHLKTFLETTWISGHQLITFRHASLKKKLFERYLSNADDEIRSINVFFTEFYKQYQTIKDFASARLVYHYDQASMSKELIQYLRSTESRYIKRSDRHTYFQKYRCKKNTLGQDNIMNQRAYLCGTCSMQFRLGPYTMSKSACFICTNMILGSFTGGSAPANKFEARLCQNHGSKGYPYSVQCALCKLPIPMKDGRPSGPIPPTPANICLDCWFTNRGVSRCCAVE